MWEGAGSSMNIFTADLALAISRLT
ncbi:MAG: hypothetical protein RIR91_1967, partial [Verrucomicrobiota bacterium]